MVLIFQIKSILIAFWLLNCLSNWNFIYQKLQEIETEKYEANTRLSYYKNLQGYLDNSDDIKRISSPSMVGIDDSNLSSMLQKLSELYNRKELLSYSVNENSPSYILVEKEINLIIYRFPIRGKLSIIRFKDKLFPPFQNWDI